MSSCAPWLSLPIQLAVSAAQLLNPLLAQGVSKLHCGSMEEEGPAEVGVNPISAAGQLRDF